MGNKIVNPITNKIISVIIFLVAGIVCFLATREYIEITQLHKPPRHPFGNVEKWMAKADAQIEGGISVVLKDYNKFLLFTAGGSFLVGGMFVLAWFVDKIFKFAYIVLIGVATYFIYTRYIM
ncbi:MAG: hypothetical protein IT247_04180 [Bacteroidia bacterium]|nr:hypothetical protein [Bacteroidia bacterium]